MKQYKVFEIETAYSNETYMFEYIENTNKSAERQAEDFMAKHCFCDNFEIISIRDATQSEVDVLNKIINEHKNDPDFDFWDAQTAVMYPNHDSINEIIVKLANKEG